MFLTEHIYDSHMVHGAALDAPGCGGGGKGRGGTGKILARWSSSVMGHWSLAMVSQESLLLGTSDYSGLF